MVRRKLQFSGRSYYVSVPKPWVRANGLDAGDEVEVVWGSDVTVRLPRPRCPDCGAVLEVIRVGEYMGEPIWGYRCRRCGFQEGPDG